MLSTYLCENTLILVCQSLFESNSSIFSLQAQNSATASFKTPTGPAVRVFNQFLNLPVKQEPRNDFLSFSEFLEEVSRVVWFVAIFIVFTTKRAYFLQPTRLKFDSKALNYLTHSNLKSSYSGGVNIKHSNSEPIQNLNLLMFGFGTVWYYNEIAQR